MLGDTVAAAAVLGLIRSLPQAVVEEQIRLYRQQQREGAAAVAEKKIRVSTSLTEQERRLIAKRFDAYCQRNGMSAKKTHAIRNIEDIR